MTLRQTSIAARCILFTTFCLMANVAAVQAQFIYTTNNGAITIAKYTGSGGNVVIPNTIIVNSNNLTVTSIGERAFYECYGLASVTMGTNVTSIGNDAFGFCTNLTSVVIPDNVTNIGYQAFSYCVSMTNVTIGTGVPSIGQWAFAFCRSLTAITVDDLNPAYSSLEGVLFDKTQTTLVVCPAGKAGPYVIPENVINIVSTAFSSCARLTSITIPDSVTSIGDYVFGSCNWVTNAITLNGVVTLGVGAFFNCSRLSSITIGNGVTSIGNETFYGCWSLTSITIPNSVTNIGDGAFRLCTALTSVTIPSGVTNIGYGAFYSCTNLMAVYFQGSAPGLASSVFADSPTTVYYLPGATGWEAFPYSPRVLWNPHAVNDATFGVGVNGFGFTITNSGSPVVVTEACTNLANHNWFALATNTLTGGSSYFSDPQWTNFSTRFHRFRSP